MKNHILFLYLITNILVSSSMQHQQQAIEQGTPQSSHDAEESEWIKIGKTSSEMTTKIHPGFDSLQLSLLSSSQQESTSIIVPQEDNDAQEVEQEQDEEQLTMINLQQEDKSNLSKKPWYKKNSVNIAGIMGCACVSIGLIVATYKAINK